MTTRIGSIHPTGKQAGGPNNGPTDRLASRPVEQATGRPTDRQTGRWAKQRADRSTGGLAAGYKSTSIRPGPNAIQRATAQSPWDDGRGGSVRRRGRPEGARSREAMGKQRRFNVRPLPRPPPVRQNVRMIPDEKINKFAREYQSGIELVFMYPFPLPYTRVKSYKRTDNN